MSEKVKRYFIKDSELKALNKILDVGTSEGSLYWVYEDQVQQLARSQAHLVTSTPLFFSVDGEGHVVALLLRGYGAFMNSFPYLRCFPRLKGLDLRHNEIKNLNSFPFLESLEQLDLSNNQFDKAPTKAEIKAIFPNLEICFLEPSENILLDTADFEGPGIMMYYSSLTHDLNEAYGFIFGRPLLEVVHEKE